jgi:NTP pyrophosphatase (non-canonical NTP hydrolase)
MSDINWYQRWAEGKWNGKGFSSEFPDPLCQQLCNAVLGEVGEGGELADLVKKLVFHKMPYTEEVAGKVKKELGDRFYYLVTLCRLFGFEATEVLDGNMAKLNARYPEGFSEERSNNRNEAQEG